MSQFELSRRTFVALLGTLGVGAGIAACNPAQGSGAPAAGTPTPADEHGAGGSGAGAVDADEMDRMHEERTKAFPAPSDVRGGQPLPFTLE